MSLRNDANALRLFAIARLAQGGEGGGRVG